MRRFTKKRFIGALSVIAVLAAAGAAIAYFTSTGTGSGTGSVGTATSWAVDGGSVVGTLYPDTSVTGPDQGVVTNASVTNNATSGNQNLNKIVATISSVTNGGTDSSENPCSTSDFQFNSPGGTPAWTGTGTQTATILPNTDLAAGDSYAIGDLNVVMVDNGQPQDNCQGATVHVTFDAS